MTGISRLRRRLALMYVAVVAAIGLVLAVLLIAIGPQPRAYASGPVQHGDVLGMPPALAGVGLLVVVSTLPVGWLVAGRAVTPVRDAFDSQGRFIANAAHELLTPVAAARTALQVALADPEASPDKLRRVCERVLASGREQQRLVDALLTLASAERGLEQTQEVDLTSLSDATGDAVVVRGDPVLLARLVANLKDNAVEHNVPDGWITVETGHDRHKAFLRIANSGPPIAADQVESLFEPFRRLAAERVGDHHGLGLSIVRAIAHAHGATITTNPVPEGGLSIRVSFPPATQSSEPTPDRQRRDSPT